MKSWPPALRVGFWMDVKAIGFAIMLNTVRHLSDNGQFGVARLRAKSLGAAA